MSVDVEYGRETESLDPGEAMDRAEAMFPPERREQIAQFLEVPANHPAFLPFLAICAAYGLNPVMGEIWLIPQKIRERRDGQWVTTGMRYRPSVGRDGLLRVARRDSNYLGIKHDVVCQNDTFVVKHDTTSFDAAPEITHVYAEKEDGKSSKMSRGPVIGAWAVLYLRNRPPVYYFADAAEHAKTKTVDGHKVYDGSWTYTSAMLIKAAVSYVCRLGTGITGLLPADEMNLPTLEAVKQGALMPGEDEGAEIPGEEDFWDGIRNDLDGDDVATMALRARYAGKPLAEIEMTLAGLDIDSLHALIQEEPAEADLVEEPDVIALRERIMELEAQLTDADVISQAEIRSEIAQIEEELARIAGDAPGQEPLL